MREILSQRFKKIYKEIGRLQNIKPQIKVPRVAPLEGASTSTVAPVDVAHTYGSPPYVDIAGRYAPAGAYVSMHCGGHD
ncbi:MAG: hypothetical protein KKA10_08470, partial [Euryarchaeota archaeon]|nr:hypothetical protein [Euryarchaeota archaeon]MBU4454699.1 hypothetical protein [Euryarchaeota archaeon]